MPLDADVAAALEVLRTTGAPKLSEGSVAEARRNYDAAPKPPSDPLRRVDDTAVSGPGGDVPVRLYAATDDRRLPVVVFFHGGGWVLSSVEGHDPLARRIASLTGALVVSVDYRLAPEHPYPAAHDDCWATTTWLAEHAVEWGGDPARIAVAGDSAGGNLAAGVALRARDEGVPLVFQALMYPCIDDRQGSYPSMAENATGLFLEAADMRWFWDHFVPTEHRDDPYAVPARVESLGGVAPALVQTAEFDPLRDEGEAYAARLAAAGVAVTATRYPGVVHGFVTRWHAMARALDAHDELGRTLGDVFDATT